MSVKQSIALFWYVWHEQDEWQDANDPPAVILVGKFKQYNDQW